MNTNSEFLSSELPGNYNEILDREKLIRYQHVTDVDDSMRNAWNKGALSTQYSVRTLIARTLPVVLDCAYALINNLKTPTAIPSKGHLKQFSNENYEAYCYLALTTMFDESTKSNALSHVYGNIAKVCEEEARIAFWKKNAPRFFKTVMTRQQNNTHNSHWINAGLTVAMNRYTDGYYGAPKPEAAWNAWSASYKNWLASTLVNIILNKTELFEIVRLPYAGKKNKADVGYKLQPSQALLQWIGNATDALGLHGGFYLPIPAQPRHWTTTQNGGYWTIYGGQLKLVKNRNAAYQEEILNNPEQFKQVFSAVNAAQDTAWRINQRVYAVLKELVREGQPSAGLPSANPLPQPRCPRCGAEILSGIEHECLRDGAVLNTWKGLSKAIHRKNARAGGQRLRVNMILETAEILLNDPRFYYVYQTDFRGRLYPVGTVTPQGADFEKGILEFADGVPLGEDGVKWLAVHVANCWGNDKVDYPERVQWVKDNTSWIKDCAREPLIYREWTEADSPFMFLAACMEWDGYCEQGSSYVSHLPVGLDGSCSGIQHYSALLRDEVGAIATNVKCVPNQHVKSDIYGLVAAEAITQFRKDAVGEDPKNASFAMFMLAHNLMDRKITKRAVMTLPYGVTFQSARDYITEALNERPEIERYDQTTVKDLLTYVSNTVWKAIPKVVKGARLGMSYLKSTAKLAAKTGAPITWIAPSGFVVCQSYYLQDVKRITTALHGGITLKNGLPCWTPSGKVQISMSEDSRYIDEARQVSGIAPNFIHSLDASHLVYSVNEAKKHNITNFALVHDSLGVHAGNTEEFSKILREQFYKLYADYKPLEDFTDNIKPLLIEADLKKLQRIPTIGTLHLEDILKAKFLFS